VIGQVWANILHNVHADLVEKYGFSTTALTNADGTEGNVVFLRLLVDALALQPVSPTCEFHLLYVNWKLPYRHGPIPSRIRTSSMDPS